MAALVYLDTNIFIRGFEFEGVEAQPVLELLAFLKDYPQAAATSELTLAELLSPSKNANDLPLAWKAELYRNLLIWSGLIDLWPLKRNLLIATAALRQIWPYKLADAIHVVTAVYAECKFFMSSDSDTRKLPPGLHRLLPDRAGVETIMEALHA